jgi:heat shock protein HslJ
MADRLIHMKWRYVVLAVLVAGVAAACADPSSTTDTQPTGALPPDTTTTTTGSDGGDAARPSLGPIEGDWLLVGGVPLVDGYPVSFSASVNDVGGRAACNQYGGSATIDGDRITFGTMFQTEMACEPSVMDTEAAYLAALGAATSWSLVDDELTLTGPEVTLVFDRAPAVPTEALVGTRWLLDTLVQDDMAFTPVGDPAFLLLAEDGTLTGSTGCRDLTGTWIEAGGEIVFTQFAADGECPTDVADQDSLVVTVLGDGFTAEIDGDLLSVTSMGSEGLVYRAAGD